MNVYRIDTFSVPPASRPDFEAAMRRSVAFLSALPGCRTALVFEQTGGPSSFNVITLVEWESEDAHRQAAARVRAYYQEIGFDPLTTIQRLGVTAQLGDYRQAP